MDKTTHHKEKSRFMSPQIRKLSTKEMRFYIKAQKVCNKQVPKATIAKLPAFVSQDGKKRSLILTRMIIEKIENDHGKIGIENLIINANDWEYVIKNVDGNPDKINLIKTIPGSYNLVTIGANRANGFFMVTHYETSTRSPNKLKNLLQNRGDSLDHTGGAAVPSFATFSEETA